jgi:F-type H+-transporting ATPase subunit gamma
MPSLQQLRRRLKGIRSIHQITKAMEMIATSKMQKAVKKNLQSRIYSAMLLGIANRLMGYPHPLCESRKAERVLLLFLTSNRGLCGGFNSSLLKTLDDFLKEHADKEIKIITIGKKGRDYVARYRPESLVADFSGINEEILYQEVTPVAHLLIEEYLQKQIDAVFLLYNHFISSFVQEPTVLQLLPLNIQKENLSQEEFLLEPSPQKLLDFLIPRVIETQLYQALLESKASEHSARMVAMSNANKNAEELIDELYLTYHSIRQATITSELTDMISTKKAMEEV